MPKLIDQTELERLLQLLGQSPQGLRIAELEWAARAQRLHLDRRTLQRRLAQLVSSDHVVIDGRGRARRYRLAPVSASLDIVEASDTLTPSAEIYVPISTEAENVKALVRRPITERAPVGYNRSFLERYEPNRSAYLPQSIRGHLHAMARSPFAERPAGTYARDILNRLLIDLSWASSRLEGNTYSRIETQNLIEFGQAADGRDRREAQMILNHKAAIEMLVEHADEVGFNVHTFFNLHALLSENLMLDARASGRLRNNIVEIAGSVFHPLAVPQQIDQYFRTILQKADAATDPFEQAFFVMVHIPYLQPFEDVNKRVSRIGANISLIKRNLSPLSFVDVPEKAYIDATLAIYELNRIELLRDLFVWAYERSCQRYVAVKDRVPEPDALRLRYRQELTDVVGEIVRGLKPIDTKVIRTAAQSLVKREDLRQFVAMAFNDLQHLHEGSVARYRLLLAEYEAWKKSRR